MKETIKKHSTKMQKIRSSLLLIAALAAGGAAGFALAAYTDISSGGKATAWILLFRVIFMAFCIYAAFYLQAAFHETGHMICALLSGYRFLSFRVGGFMWMRQGGRIRLKRFSLAGTGGQCLMDPPDLQDGQAPYILYNLGGALANLITSFILIGGYLIFRGNWYLSAFLLTMAGVGIWLAAINGVPLKLGMVNNDGRNIIDIGKNKEEIYGFWVQMKIAVCQTEGIRLKDMPSEWFQVPPVEEIRHPMTAARAVFAANRLMDEHAFAEAADLIDRILRADADLIGLYRMLLIPDRVYCELVGERNQEILEQWNEGQLQKFIRQMKNYPQMIRAEYSYALLEESDQEKAEKIRQRFERAAESYPYPSDLESERELLEIAETVWKSRMTQEVQTWQTF